ncbi:MAG: hypothetical protein K6U74_21355 [Firmicutes bacterium]|nr:hypothetical protein [Bacillota bacterium]
MGIKLIKQTDLAKIRAVEAAKEQRIQDLELTIAEQIAAYNELLQRQQDTELLLADIIAQGGV